MGAIYWQAGQLRTIRVYSSGWISVSNAFEYRGCPLDKVIGPPVEDNDHEYTLEEIERAEPVIRQWADEVWTRNDPWLVTDPDAATYGLPKRRQTA